MLSVGLLRRENALPVLPFGRGAAVQPAPWCPPVLDVPVMSAHAAGTLTDVGRMEVDN